MLLEQVLLIVGATIFGLLGAIHLYYTFFTNKFDAVDENVTHSMKVTSPVISKETTILKSVVGFNASHSLGAMLITAVYVPLAINHMDMVRQSLWFSTLPAILGLAYVVLAKNYWFRIPFIGISIATACFVGAALLLTL